MAIPLTHMLTIDLFKSVKFIKKRAFIALFILLVSCHSKPSYWKLEKIQTTPKCLSFRRLFFTSPDTFCPITLEIIQSNSNLRIFINMLSHSISTEASCTTLVQINSDSDSKTFDASICKGGQKIFLPASSYEWIINNLLENNSLAIEIGRIKAVILPSNFSKMYLQAN